MTVASKDGVVTGLVGGAMICVVGAGVARWARWTPVGAVGADALGAMSSVWANTGALVQNKTAAHNTTDGAEAIRERLKSRNRLSNGNIFVGLLVSGSLLVRGRLLICGQPSFLPLQPAEPLR